MTSSIKSARDIGVVIKAQRIALGLGQADLADQIGVSRRWLNQIEQGKPGASIGLILQALAALKVDLIATHPNDASPSDMALSPILITADIDQVLDDLSDEKEERS